jgi:hypothetical protein
VWAQTVVRQRIETRTIAHRYLPPTKVCSSQYESFTINGGHRQLPASPDAVRRASEVPAVETKAPNAVVNSTQCADKSSKASAARLRAAHCAVPEALWVDDANEAVTVAAAITATKMACAMYRTFRRFFSDSSSHSFFSFSFAADELQRGAGCVVAKVGGHKSQ